MVDESDLPDRYRNPELIARGGMGEVYRAEDADLARVVAVKLLSGRFADNEAIRGRFTREALAVARLSHAPNTVTIFDVGEHGGRPYIVMEYLPGGSLADRLEREGAQPVGRSLEWLGQAAAALDAAHAHGIVHRDVKPANLLLDDDERVKVADFGVASAADLGSFTEAGTVVGTAGYLAPEQARGERATPRERPLRARRRRLRAPDRQASVRARVLDGGGDGARERTDPAGVGLESDAAAASSTTCSLGASRRSPSIGIASAADFVDALHDALDREAGTTRVAAIPPVVQPRGRRRVPLLLLLLAGALLAGILAAALLARDDGERRWRRRPHRRRPPSTVQKTVTLPGTTVVQTVTTAPEPPATTTASRPRLRPRRGRARRSSTTRASS